MASQCDTGGGFPSAGDVKNISRDHSVIWGEINAIQQAILAATTGCVTDPDTNTCVRAVGDGYCALIGGDTPMTWIDSLATVTVTNGGTDYLPVAAFATFFRPTGVTGTTDATADVVTTTSGLVTNFNITVPGDGYDPMVATASVVSAGTGAQITTIVDSDTGTITSATIDAAGTGYTAGDVVTITHTVGTGADVVIGTVDTGGEILSLTINSGGVDYQTLYSTVTVSHPTGQGFEGTVQTSAGAVIGVSIQAAGLLYADLYPSAVFTDGLGEDTVVVLVDDSTPGPIESVTILNGGYGFQEDSVGTIVAAKDVNDDDVGTGATISITVNFNPYGTTPNDYYLAVIGQGSCAAKDAVEQVIFYFTSLGYTITPIPDPATGTISWEVCWC